ncbi:MAG: hypothetical protein ACLRZ6_02150 [Lachnospiraceae bacterium]
MVTNLAQMARLYREYESEEAPSTMTTPFDNMSPEKAQFIKQIVSEASGKVKTSCFHFFWH